MNDFSLAPSVAITYMQADVNYTWIHYADGHKIIQCTTLLKLMSRYPFMIRLHKCYAVNINRIATTQLVVAHRQPSLTLFVDEENHTKHFAVARRRFEEVRQRLAQRQGGVS